MSDFDALSDDALLHAPELPHAQHASSHSLEESHLLFQYDRYDWNGFKPNFLIVRLTKGYFAIVRKTDWRHVKNKKLWANVQLDKVTGRILKVYACWSPPRKKGKKRSHVYLHRLVTDAGKGEIVDHVFGLSLDCRKECLRVTDHSGNRGNARSTGRLTNHGLKQGVELRARGTRYGGQIKVHGVTYRSKKMWRATPEGEQAAHKWYLNRHKEFFKHRGLPENGGAAKYPIFPPLKQETQSVGVLLTETF